MGWAVGDVWNDDLDDYLTASVASSESLIILYCSFNMSYLSFLCLVYLGVGFDFNVYDSD